MKKDKRPKKDAEKFLFDLYNFDDGTIESPALRTHKADTEEQVEPPPPPPPPTFSEEELELAKKQAFEEGRKQGDEDATARHDAALQSTLNMINAQIPALVTTADERRKFYEQEVLRLCRVLFKKLFPQMMKTYGLSELLTRIQDTLAQQPSKGEIEILIHPDQSTPVQKMLEEADHQGHIIVTPSAKINNNTCQIKWHDGGSLFCPDQIYEQILSILPEPAAVEAPVEENEPAEEAARAGTPPEQNDEEAINTDNIEDSPFEEKCDTLDNEASLTQDEETDGDNQSNDKNKKEQP